MLLLKHSTRLVLPSSGRPVSAEIETKPTCSLVCCSAAAAVMRQLLTRRRLHRNMSIARRVGTASQAAGGCRRGAMVAAAAVRCRPCRAL